HHVIGSLPIRLPRLITPDAERTGIRRLGNAFAAEESLIHAPPPLIELGRTETYVDIVWIGVDNVEMVIAVTMIISNLTSASSRRSYRVSPENPITDIDSMNILFNDDIAGEDSVVDPVTKPALFRCCTRPVGPVNGGPKIVGLPGSDRAECTIVNSPHEFHKRRCVANLESDVKSLFILRLLADF